MTKAYKRADEIAQLESEVEALKAAQPKPQKSWEEMERENREWMDQMHQMRERRMNCATPPSVIRDWNVLSDRDVRGVVNSARAPTGPSPMAPSSPTDAGASRRCSWRRHRLGALSAARTASRRCPSRQIDGRTRSERPA